MPNLCPEIAGSNFTGTLAGKMSSDGTVTLPGSVDPCSLPASIYHERWNGPVIEPDLDVDDDGLLTVKDMISHMLCPVD